jgi:hypothetical protein
MQNATRNSKGRLVIDKNKTTDASIPIRVLDERFLMQDFNYVVDVKFKSLKNAVTAEDYVLGVLDVINGNILNQTNLEGDFQSTINLTEIPTVETFLSDIGNLISNDPNSEAAQRYRISKLEQEVEQLQQNSTAKNQEIYQQTENLITANLAIDEKNEEIEQLKSTIETLINELPNE